MEQNIGISKIKCRKCEEVKDVKKFSKSPYTDSKYEFYCKDCKAKILESKDRLIFYVNEHYQKFNDKVYDIAIKKAQQELPEGTEEEIFKKAVGKYFRILNIGGSKPDKLEIENKIEQEVITVEQDEDEKARERLRNVKNYSDKWKGNYNKFEIEYLEEYLYGLQQDFNIITTNHKDYAMKIAKASLAMDNAYEEMINGNEKNAEKKYEVCKRIFDDLCKSAQFSESTRGQNDVVGLGSIGVIVKRIEEKGFVDTSKYHDIPNDNTEKVLTDFLYTITNSGGI